MDNLNLIRAVNVKKVNFESIDKSSELYQLYKNNELTKEKLFTSTDNIFVVAFFYNELYEISEYLHHLKSLPISNQIYNVLKMYLKCLKPLDIKLFFNSTPIHTTLKGEMYRICKIEIDDFSPYFLYGYCTSGQILLPNFENTFDMHIENCVELLSLLDLNHERISKSVVKNIHICFDYLISKNLFTSVIEHVDFNILINSNEKIPECRFHKICKIFKCADLKNTAVAKLKDITNCTDLLEIATLICEDRTVYAENKSFFLKYISKLKKIDNPKAIFDFLFVALYYDVLSFDRKFVEDLCKRFSLCDTEEYLLLLKEQSYHESENIIEKIKNCKNFRDLTKLFAKFTVFVEKMKPGLQMILELPEKFFSYGLNFINSESAKNLKIFNDNLLNERLKQSIFTKIDPHDFALYLIKRYKIFPVNLSEYEFLMDNKYKQMYGLTNLKWASEHIDELKNGLEDRLYRALKNSQYSECLNGISYLETKPIEVCTIPENEIYSAIDYSNPKKFKPYDYEVISNDENSDFSKYDDESILSYEDASDVKNIESESDENIKQYFLTNSNLIIQAIYDEFCSEKSNFSKFISQIKNSNDFSYILEILFGFTSKNKKIEKFYLFFKESITHFTLQYLKHKEMIECLFEKFKEKELFEICAFSINLQDLKTFINDFPYTESIYQGLKKRINEKGNCQELNDIVKDLVFSSFVPGVVIGSKLFSLLDVMDFNLNHLISFKRDEVVYEAVKQLKGKTHNNKLVSLLLGRGLTDELSAMICQKLDVEQLNEKNLQRIYSLFYLNPLNFIKFEIYKYGFGLDEHIVLDLIKAMSSTYSESVFEKVTSILSSFEFTQSCYDQMVSVLDTSNYLFKVWIFKNLKTDNISLPFFVKLCWYVCNEDDIEFVEKAIRILKNGRIFDIIEKWAQFKKFERLNRRIYPLKLTNIDFYKKLLENCPNEEEKAMLMAVYNL